MCASSRKAPPRQAREDEARSFQFFRATYYRWAQSWRAICGEAANAPSLLAVGDLHVDSFGTWRDVEGRLCWGVDDFDEAWPLPYTNDLIRLAASVKIARKMGLLSLKTRAACELIVEAYRETIEKRGSPIVLAEKQRHLETLGIAALKTPDHFWEKLKGRKTIGNGIPRQAKRLLERMFPIRDLQYRIVRREGGLGSLGQERFVAIAYCHGGCIAREAKRVVPAANMWLNGHVSHRQSYCQRALMRAVRSQDPYQAVIDSWLIRRLSPDSNPVKMEELCGDRDEETLLRAMGSETANVHLEDKRRVKFILADLKDRKSNWLHAAARKMARQNIEDWKDYRN